jgi:hypothetical protein
MLAVDPFSHMEEAWKLESNPFPAEAIRNLGTKSQPYSDEVFPQETQDFRRKFVRGMLLGSASIGFLWSEGQRNDTGYGKTTLMQAVRNEVNSDMGATTLQKAGMKAERVRPIAAALANLNTLQATGLYPVLFQATVDLTLAPEGGQKAVFEAARERICSEIDNDDPAQIALEVQEAWLGIAPGGGPLRPDLVAAFAQGGATATRIALSAVSDAMRLRAGIQFLDFSLAVLAAARVEALILMIDQLEDLATNKAIPSSKRSKEIGRIRDLLELPPYADRLKLVFTFHNRAAQVLERFWESNRLPRFENIPENASAVVALRGLPDDESAAKLLAVYLESARLEPIADELLPFEIEAVAALRQAAESRPGILLALAHKLIDHAANQGLPVISGDTARKFLSGDIDLPERDLSDFDVDDQNVDDILLG